MAVPLATGSKGILKKPGYEKVHVCPWVGGGEVKPGQTPLLFIQCPFSLINFDGKNWMSTDVLKIGSIIRFNMNLSKSY